MVSVSGSSFGKRVLGNTAFAIADLLLTKSTNIVAFVLLVRLVPSESIAAVGVATGYLVFLAYFDVAPIRVLLRDYPKFSENYAKRNELLTALFLFWGLQTIAMLVAACGIGVAVLGPLEIEGLAAVYFAMAFDFVVLTLQGWIKVVYYSSFLQRAATRISLVLGIARLASYSILIISPHLEAYALILSLTALGSAIVWSLAFRKQFRFRLIVHSNAPSVLRQSLLDYGLWDHFNRIIIDTLFTIDLAILAWFVSVRDMSNYTIALKFTSLLTLVPAQLNAALQVALANYKSEEKRTLAINTLLKANSVLSLAQLVVFLLFGDWMLRLLFGHDVQPDVITYVTIIAIGVTIFNVFYPLLSIVNNFCQLRLAFLSIFLPALVIGLVSYITGAWQFGAMGVAFSNIVAYSWLAIALALFVRKNYPIAVSFQLITPAEKALVREVIGRRRQ